VDQARFSSLGLVVMFAVGFALIVILKRTPKLGVALMAVAGLLGLFMFTARVRHSAPPPMDQGVTFMEFQGMRMVAPSAPRAPQAPRVYRVLETFHEPADVHVEEPFIVAGPVEPPVAVSDDAIPLDPAPQVTDSETPFTLFQGLSTDGRPVESPPSWVNRPDSTTPGALLGTTLSSERFATIAEAERQLWEKLRTTAGEVLHQSFPDSRGWLPPRELLERASVVMERCVEQTELTIGTHVEPVFRVHWRVALTDSTRDMLARAWTPTLANERMTAVGSVFGGIAGAFLLLNLILRGLTSSVWQRLTSRKVAAAAVAGGLLLAGVGLLVG
jgi:hypothetical protein